MGVVLRPMLASDADVFASWAADSRICAHAGWTTRSDIDELVPWWRALIENPDPTLLRMTAVCDGDVVGYVDLHGDSDRKSTRLNSSHVAISYAVFCLKKKRR